MKPLYFVFSALLGSLLVHSMASAAAVDQSQNARELARELMIVDTHIDVPYRIEEQWEDVTQSTEEGDFD
jgi:membrane dipeptidase